MRGFWGACGAGISAGMFISIITESNPLKNKPFGQSNKMTAKALMEIEATTNLLKLLKSTTRN